ncbi:hypothetical protein E3A20_00250 [Planctomyces bekefii]|uniref:Cytochrome P460 domain-containing protein n=1 Tax=Planctomyces bekefii TaxID=1653850 RepID=A0A5C6ME82_9PLAN|nr:hypothetical protein E3A20_00250 [Planctomyces bekefii]
MRPLSNLSPVTTAVLSGTVAFVLSAGCKEPSSRTKIAGSEMIGVKSENDADAKSANAGGGVAKGGQNSQSNPDDGDNDSDGTNGSTGNNSTGNGSTANNQQSGGANNTATNQSQSGSNGTANQNLGQTLDNVGPNGPGAFNLNFRSSADFFTNMASSYEGRSPHGQVRIWYSTNIRDMINRATFKAPVGTVAIKKFQNTKGSGFAVMIKKSPGYDPKNHDWYFEMRQDDGTIAADPAPGKIAECAACHAAAQAKDFLAGTELGLDPEDLAQNPAQTPDAAGGTTKDPDFVPADPNAPKGPGAFQSDFSSSKSFFSNTPEPILGVSPHGKVRVWYSINLKPMLSNAKIAAPEGTVAIKEFDNDGKPGVDGVAVMIKKAAGYDMKNNDWYYELRDPWGTLLKSPAPGKISTCSGCHASAIATDFLAATKLTSAAGTGQSGPSKFVADYAASPSFFTRMRTMGPETGTHGSVQIWYSLNAKDKIGVNGAKLPDGTTAIARFQKGDQAGVLVMIKEPGSDSAHNDWRYEVRDRYGNLTWNPRPGAVPECIACHKQAAPTDYLKGSLYVN